MGDADDIDVLEAGRKEITLDRPPVAFKGGGESNEPNLSLRYSCAVDGIVEKQVIPNGLDKISFSPGGVFEPLSCSEKVDENTTSKEEDQIIEQKVDVGSSSEQNDIKFSAETISNDDSISSSSSSQEKNNVNYTSNGQQGYLKKNASKRKRKKELVSCLKKRGSPKINHTIKRKSVKFLDGLDIVSELIEPVDPWRDVRTPSKAEVVSFYRNSCQKLRSRPIEKVIKQIQDIPDLSCRAGTLVLRGCRLDSRSCEALESVLRRIQFENLDLENCGLEEEGATSLLEMIEFYHSTCKLNIAFNPKIGMRGWQALCRMLRKTSCLTYLDARRTLLTDMTMPTFGRCLKADPPLKILHLENVYLSGRPLLILTTAMKYNRILEELYIGDNDLTVNDGPPIGAMLTYNTTLQLLDLRNNHLKDIGLAHIGNGLCDQADQGNGGGLSSLILWNNQITHEGMAYICEGLVRTKSLKALNLGQNRLGDLGLQKLKAGLIKNKSIRKLGFLNTKVGSEGAVALAEVLADSLCITRIDIRENHIQVAGLMAFSMALKVNHSLLRLDLDKDIKKEPGMESVMQAVLVDIYNLCHRNKQLLHEENSVEVDGANIIRQSSISSEASDIANNEDFFHPETRRQEVVPFSPVVPNPDSSVQGFVFPNPAKLPVDVQTANAKSDTSKNNEVLESQKSSMEIAKRPNRFSVTKIFDNVGHFGIGVANKIVDNVTNMNKLKRNSKDKIEMNSSELLPMSDQLSNNTTENNTSSNVNKTINESSNSDSVVVDNIIVQSTQTVNTDQPSDQNQSQISQNINSNTGETSDIQVPVSTAISGDDKNIKDNGTDNLDSNLSGTVPKDTGNVSPDNNTTNNKTLTSKLNSDSSADEKDLLIENSSTNNLSSHTKDDTSFVDGSDERNSLEIHENSRTDILHVEENFQKDESNVSSDEEKNKAVKNNEQKDKPSLSCSTNEDFSEEFSSENVFRRVDSLSSPTSMVIHGTVALDLTS